MLCTSAVVTAELPSTALVKVITSLPALLDTVPTVFPLRVRVEPLVSALKVPLLLKTSCAFAPPVRASVSEAPPQFPDPPLKAPRSMSLGVAPGASTIALAPSV